MLEDKDRMESADSSTNNPGQPASQEVTPEAIAPAAPQAEPVTELQTEQVVESQAESPAMELPEIPAPTPGPAPVPLYNPPKPEPRTSGGGWRTFAAAVALVALSTAIGSGSTYYLMSQNQSNSRPIGVVETPVKTISQNSTIPVASAGNVIGDIFRDVSPAVVAVSVTSGFQGEGQGSGFVVDSRGYILTNYHVIEGADRISVKFVDGTTLAAKVIGTVKRKDLALLQVDPGNRTLIAAPLGDSDDVEVGEMAIAIGNPFGQEFTVTAGIISGLDREIEEEGAEAVVIPGAIQTDAAINPGNSGGPLINSRGEVVGINTAIDSPLRANVGIGFAVPINAAKEVLPNLIEGKKVQYAFLGVGLLDMDRQTARLLGTDVTYGAIVRSVQEGSAAEEAGLRAPTFDDSGYPKTADVIIEADGARIASANDLISLIARKKVGDQLTLVVLRGDERITLTATLGGREADE